MKKVTYIHCVIIFVLFNMLATFPSFTQNLPFRNHVIAYYPFNGNTNDIIGNNSPVFNNATPTSDRFGNANSAYAFNGSQYILGDCSNYPANSRTISLWFKIMDSSKNNTLFGYGGGSPCGTSLFGSWSTGPEYGVFRHCVLTGCSDNNQTRDYVWKNLIVTTGNDTTKLYLNGILFKTCSGMDFNGTNVPGKDFVFGSCINPNGKGAYSDANVDYLIGSLDDIVIYDTILKQNEIDSLFQFSYASTSQQNSNALYFDGSNDRVQIFDNPLLSPPNISIQAWVREDDITGWPWRGVVTKRDCCGSNFEQWTMQTEGNGLMSFHAITDDVGPFITDTVLLQLGVWTHFTATYDGHTANLYRNGILSIQDTTPRGNITSKPFVVVIGDREGGQDLWPGAIDEVRIWDRALTQQEILANMNCHLSGNEPGLIAYYDFNQGVPGGNNSGVLTLPDLTGHGLDGKLQNFALSGNSSNWVASAFTDLSVSIITQPKDTLINTGNSARFIVSSTNTPATYQWQTDSGMGFEDIIDGPQYAGNLNDTLIINSATAANNNQLFRSIVSSPGFCPDTSTVATLGVMGVVGLHLISFDAVKEDKKVVLKWNSENEANLSHYIVERSLDGHNFYSIGSVIPLNSSNPHYYNLSDLNPFRGMSFYRLKITEMDGTYSYSVIRKIDFKNNDRIKIYPNPASGKFIVDFGKSFDSKIKTILVRDVLGQNVFQTESNNQLLEINLEGKVRSGTYVVEVIDEKRIRIEIRKITIR